MLVDQPWEFVKDGMLNGTATPCLATEVLERLRDGDKLVEQERIAKNCAGIVYLAGNDTTSASAILFVLAMAMYPDVQKKAQAELDAFLGDRLPDFDDLGSLPYINAVIKETLRWQPVTPIGVPHCSMQDDEYDGFFIPKGSIVVGNSWSILHDSDIYPDPEEFRPDRFLKDGQLNPDIKDVTAVFGYGRRQCPGQIMATELLFAVISSVLTAFDIATPLDESGNPIKLRPAMTTDALSFPLPYKCIIKPRSDVAASLICDPVEI